MPISLTDAARLSQDVLVKGVIEAVVMASPLAKNIPFIEMVGNAISINIETAAGMPTIQFYVPNDTWIESTGFTAARSFALAIMGGDADVDNFIQTTRSNVNDQMAVQVALKAKELAFAFDRCAIYGVSGASKEFNGLHWYAVNFSCPRFSMGTGTAGAALSVFRLDEAIDALEDTPDFLLMNKAMRRRFQVYLRSRNNVDVSKDKWGDYVPKYRAIPMVVSDHLTQTEALVSGVFNARTGGNTTSIFAVKTGEGEGLVGLQNGGVQTEVFPKLETKDATRTRLKWYVALALYKSLSLARVDGITDAAFVD